MYCNKESCKGPVKPEITFFRAVYNRYSNFSRESIPQYFNLTPNFGNRVTAVLSKNGHMIGSIFLNIVLVNQLVH